MSTQPRSASLEVEQDLRYQRWEWRLQRVGWVVIVLFIVAALLGLLGEGPLGQASQTAPDGSAALEYQRLLHFHNPNELRLAIDAKANEGKELRLWVSAEYLRDVDINSILPEPIRMEAGADGHTFVFAVASPGQPTNITIHFEADRAGLIHGEIKVEGRDAIAFGHFVYP